VEQALKLVFDINIETFRERVSDIRIIDSEHDINELIATVAC